jgi:hypothetical protein
MLQSITLWSPAAAVQVLTLFHTMEQQAVAAVVAYVQQLPQQAVAVA